MQPFFSSGLDIGWVEDGSESVVAGSGSDGASDDSKGGCSSLGSGCNGRLRSRQELITGVAWVHVTALAASVAVAARVRRWHQWWHVSPKRQAAAIGGAGRWQKTILS